MSSGGKLLSALTLLISSLFNNNFKVNQPCSSISISCYLKLLLHHNWETFTSASLTADFADSTNTNVDKLINYDTSLYIKLCSSI